MKNTQYTAEQSLERIKLMMGYDMSKTLNENRQIIFEQDVNVDVDTVNKEITKGALVNSNEQLIVDTLKKYTTKKDLQNFLNQFKVKTGTEFINVISRVMDPSRDKDEIQDLNDHLATLGVTFNMKYDPISKKYITTFEGLSGVKSNGTSAPSQTPVSYQIPSELGNIEGVKKFQNWLDANHPGWVNKYGTLNGDVNKGFGKFGPSTNRAWQNVEWKQEYLNSLQQQTPTNTPPDRTQGVQDLANTTQTSTRANMGRPNLGTINSAATQARPPKVG